MGGGNYIKYLKGWNRKEGRGHKDLKKAGQAVSVGGSVCIPSHPFFMVRYMCCSS